MGVAPEGVDGHRADRANHVGLRVRSQSSTALALRPGTTSRSRPRRSRRSWWRRWCGGRSWPAGTPPRRGLGHRRPPSAGDRPPVAARRRRRGHDRLPPHAELTGHARHRAVLLAHLTARLGPGPLRHRRPGGDEVGPVRSTSRRRSPPRDSARCACATRRPPAARRWAGPEVARRAGPSSALGATTRTAHHRHRRPNSWCNSPSTTAAASSRNPSMPKSATALSLVSYSTRGLLDSCLLWSAARIGGPSARVVDSQPLWPGIRIGYGRPSSRRAGFSPRRELPHRPLKAAPAREMTGQHRCGDAGAITTRTPPCRRRTPPCLPLKFRPAPPKRR